MGEKILDFWQTNCVPHARSAVLDHDLPLVGLDEEVEVVLKHIMKWNNSSFPFLTLTGPCGSGKSHVVLEALQRIYRRRNPGRQWWVGCPNCQQQQLFCTPDYKVLPLHAPASSAEAFTTLTNLINECRVDDEEEAAPLKRRDVDSLTDYFVTYRRRLLLWIQGDFNKTNLQEFLYVLTNLLHNKDAVARVSVIFETRSKLSVDLDARIASRISQASLDFRAVSAEQIARFASARLSFSSYSDAVCRPVIGNVGDSVDRSVSYDAFVARDVALTARFTQTHGTSEDAAHHLARHLQEHMPQYVELHIEHTPKGKTVVTTVLSCSVVLSDEKKLSVDMQTGEVQCETLKRKHSNPMQQVPLSTQKGTSVHRRELWPDYDSRITGLWFTKQGGYVVGVGLVTAKSPQSCALHAARTARMEGLCSRRTQHSAVRLWNSMVHKLCTAPLFLERLQSLGDFQVAAQQLAAWAIRLGKPLTDRGTNFLQAALPSIMAEVRQGGDWATVTARRLAFHFYTTALYRNSAVPTNTNLAALQINCVSEGVKTSEFLDTLHTDLQQQGATYAAGHVDFSSISNSQMLILCLLVRRCQAAHAQEMKRAKKTGLILDGVNEGGQEVVIDAATLAISELHMEVVPNTVLDDFITYFSRMMGPGAPSGRYNWPYVLEGDLCALLEQNMIAVSGTNIRRGTQTMSDAKVTLSVDRVNLVEYLRAQREAARESIRPSQLFAVLNLDQDTSLL